MKHVFFAAFLVTSAMSLPCLSEGVDFARCALSGWEGLGGCSLRHLRRVSGLALLAGFRRRGDEPAQLWRLCGGLPCLA
jgi:hypothetical protein